jgi:hypothetical protein
VGARRSGEATPSDARFLREACPSAVRRVPEQHQPLGVVVARSF